VEDHERLKKMNNFKLHEEQTAIMYDGDVITHVAIHRGCYIIPSNVGELSRKRIPFEEAYAMGITDIHGKQKTTSKKKKPEVNNAAEPVRDTDSDSEDV